MLTPQALPPCAVLAARVFGDYESFTDYVFDEKKRRCFLDTMLRIEVKLNDGPATFLQKLT